MMTSKQIFRRATVIIFCIVALTCGIINNAGLLQRVNTVLCGAPIYRGNEMRKEMAFMCNVYWGNEYIKPILDVLRQYGVHITFFIGGSWARDNPELLKLIFEDGHEIANHGYYHYNHSTLSPTKSTENIERNHRLIRELLGVEMELFAPPSGDYDRDTVAEAESLGYRTVLWTIDTVDWRDKDAEVFMRRVWNNRKNGALVLMHPTAHSVKGLSAVIGKLLEDGYTLDTVSRVIE